MQRLLNVIAAIVLISIGLIGLGLIDWVRLLDRY
jgi:hypothetical protein